MSLVIFVITIFISNVLGSELNLKSSKQPAVRPRALSFNDDDMMLFDELFPRSESMIDFSRTDQERSFYRLALHSPPELSVIKTMFESLLCQRSLSRTIELVSDEEASKEMEYMGGDDSIKIRLIRQDHDISDLRAELMFLFVDGRLKGSVEKAVQDLLEIREQDPDIAIGVIVLSDGLSPHLNEITGRAFDERCVAFLFEENIDSRTAWEYVKELVRVYESDRSGSCETRLRREEETPKSENDSIFGWWSTVESWYDDRWPSKCIIS